MARLEKESTPDLPDEVIEHIISFLSFADIFKLNKGGTRLGACAKRVSRTKPFSRYGNQNLLYHVMQPYHKYDKMQHRTISIL